MNEINISRFLTVVFVLFLTSACKDPARPHSIESTIDQVKSAVGGDRLPETSVDAAIANHGFQQLMKWAEDGDRKAQHFIAVAYLAGTSVPENFNESEKWALRAANQGSSASQYLLAIIKRDAAISTKNLLELEPKSVSAYMWMSLAAAQGNEPASRDLDGLQLAMDPAWVRHAQEKAANWRPCNRRECWDLEPS